MAVSLNYASQADDVAKGQNPFVGYPSGDCFGTITLCGKCVGSDVPGNVMFGFIAAAAGIPDDIRNKGADYAEATDGDGESEMLKILAVPLIALGFQIDEDRDVFPLGNELYESGINDICSVITKLPNHARSNCKPCTTKTGSFSPRFPFRSVVYPSFYSY